MKAGKLFVTVLIAVCFISGCGVQQMADVYDDNGKIASNMNAYTIVNYEQAQEDGHFTASVGEMEGMDTVWTFDAKEDTAVDITCQLNVSSGRAKLVLINPEKEVLVIAESNSEMEEAVQSTLDIKKGNNRMKIVAAENTKFDIDFTVSQGRMEELGLNG